MSERTRGKLTITEREYFEWIALDSDNMKLGGEDDLKHAVACWNAIEAIGGDPAKVGQMVEALNDLADASEYVVSSSLNDAVRLIRLADARRHARFVLAPQETEP